MYGSQPPLGCLQLVILRNLRREDQATQGHDCPSHAHIRSF
uniref:Uncharacterized protein n=1 Tax=Arundo donax TaxID=35708 RepID=A0A0A9G4G3_ARUDO